jgi:hypothetical protein
MIHPGIVARRIPFPIIRAFLLAVIAVVAASYAVVRHYTHPMQPMVVPVPRAAATTAADAGEIPAPELVLEPAH